MGASDGGETWSGGVTWRERMWRATESGVGVGVGDIVGAGDGITLGSSGWTTIGIGSGRNLGGDIGLV